MDTMQIVAAILVIGFVTQIVQLSRISQTLTRIESSLGSPNGEPPWPDVDSEGGFEEAQIPMPGDHKTVAAVLRGIYCGNATVAKLLSTRMK